MRNMLEAYAKAVGSWAQLVSNNALDRTVGALQLMKDRNYKTEDLMHDMYEYWRDLASFRAQATLGMIPAASLDISAWAGSAASNFVQIPLGAPANPLAHLGLTRVVNPETNTVLAGLELDANNGENAVRVRWVSANAGGEPDAAGDRNGLFQGGISWAHPDGHEVIAMVYVRTHLP